MDSKDAAKGSAGSTLAASRGMLIDHDVLRFIHRFLK